MLLAWNEGITGLRGKRVYSLQEWNPSSAFEGFSDPLAASAMHKEGSLEA
jgi:hypothetical protein